MSGTFRTALAVLAAAAIWGVLGAMPHQASARDESLTTAVELPPTRVEPVAWGRDPFMPLLAEVAAPDMALTAIFYNTQRPSAIINANIVYVGSVINGQKVIDIGKTHVILLSRSGKVRLELASLPELSDGDGKKR